MKTGKNKFTAGICGAALLLVFVIWTVLLGIVDVRAVGPEGSSVGFAAMNTAVRDFVGANMVIYELTDLLSIIPLGLVACFGLLGLYQFIRRRSIFKVDFDILLLGCFYVVVLCAFVLFEVVEVNYRPLLIEGVLEASYPSSTTMLSVCALSTAVMQFMARISNRVLRIAASAAAIALEVFLVVGRIISGVHWASDIIGGLLLSAGLVVLYYAAVCAVGDHITGKKNQTKE